MLNNRAPIDARKVLTGKDGALYNDEGVMLATVETFQTQVNVTNAKYQPLGDAQEHEVFQSYGVTLTFTEVVIADERFIQELFEGMKTGVMPAWNFQGVVKGTQRKRTAHDLQTVRTKRHHRSAEPFRGRHHQESLEPLCQRSSGIAELVNRLIRSLICNGGVQAYNQILMAVLHTRAANFLI